MRDRAARNWRASKTYYRVGSVFKACLNCEGYDVFRAYKPKETGWTYWCYTCGAKDENAWLNAVCGEEPFVGTRSAIREHRNQVRREQAAETRARSPRAESEPQHYSRRGEIDKLQDQLDAVLELLKTMKGGA